MNPFLFLLFACNETEKPSSDSDSEPSDNLDTAIEDSGVDMDNLDTGTNDTDNNSDDSNNNSDDSGDVEQLTLSCGPTPNDQMARMALDLFEKAMEVEEKSCFLERRDIDAENDGQIDASDSFPQPSDLICDADGDCEQTLPGFAWAWSQHSEYELDMAMGYEDMYEGRAEGVRIIQDGVERIELTLRAHLTGSTAHRRVER